jgi:GH24 family phage-related lysozyme (muramidase)
MPWITPTQNTRLKLRPIDSAQLGTNEWRDRAAGDRLGVVSARKADGQHWEVLLSGPLTIGGQQHKSCFIFAPHWEGVGAVYQAAKAKDREVSIARMDAPKSEVRLPVPYLSQTDNSENPSGSCNVTSFAMCMRYFGVKQRTNAAQFEDELYRYMQSQGLSRHSPRDLRKMAIAYGLSVDFDSKATIDRVKRHLSGGRPCVCHGYFTSFGHIVVFVGYDDRGFIVHDPYGEWHSWGYERNSSSKPTLGEYQHYSYGLIERTCLTGGEFWVHFVDRVGWQPNPVNSRDSVKTVVSAVPQHTGNKLKPQEFRVLPEAIELIKSWEGFSATRYMCSAGVPTIGWGSTRWFDGGPIPASARVNEQQATELLSRDLQQFVAQIASAIDVALTPNQLAALTSWQYNTGAIHDSTLRKVINSGGSDDAVCEQIRRWNKADGKVVQGLVNRRESECALWMGQDWRSRR